MKVRIHYSAHLNINGLENGASVDVTSGTTVSDLLSAYRMTDEHKKFITVAVNGEKKSPSCVLNDGDSLFLLLPVGGG